MTVVRMWIEKFQREVLIEDDHPLALAQRAKDAAAEAEGALEPNRSQPEDSAAASPESHENAPSGPSTADTSQGQAPAAPVAPAREPRPRGQPKKGVRY